MGWLSLTPAQLRIGLYIKLDHSWMEHPFIRNTFTVSSPSEIAIIQKRLLTRLFYDPDRSHADALVALAKPVSLVSAEPDRQFAQDVEDDENAMLKEKAVHIQHVVDHRKALDEADQNYADTAKRCSVMMAMATAGEAEGVQVATQMVTAMMDLLEQESVALSLVQSKNLDDPGQELAAQAMNVSALASLTGKMMNLNPEQLQHVALGALFHNLGQHRVPLAFRAKGAHLSPVETKLMRMYPQHGKEILEAIPGVPSKVVAIVYQHREYLDGSGSPKGSLNGDIAQLARLVGTVVEYNLLTSDRGVAQRLSPTQALSHLYVKMKARLGSDVIEPFIATMTIYPPGSFVEMSDESMGLVVKTNAQERLRPIVRLYDPNSLHAEAAVVDLARERSLTIRKSLELKSVPQNVREMLSSSQVIGYALAVT